VCECSLSNPQERAWYDSHRDALLRGANPSEDGESDQKDYEVEALGLEKYFETSCFEAYNDSPNGFYTVYSKLFAELGKLENKAQAAKRAAKRDKKSNKEKEEDYEDDGDDSDIEVPVFGSFPSPLPFFLVSLHISHIICVAGKADSENSAVSGFYTFWNHFFSRRTFSWSLDQLTAPFNPVFTIC
jgi:hypothetical protein